MTCYDKKLQINIKYLTTIACQTFVRSKREGFSLSQWFGIENKMVTRLIAVRVCERCGQIYMKHRIA